MVAKRQNMMLSSEDLITYKQRWQLVKEIEAEEKRDASVSQRWNKLNSLVRLASALNLQFSSESGQEDLVRERWQRILNYYLLQNEEQTS
jgi:hypothetical protein